MNGDRKPTAADKNISKIISNILIWSLRTKQAGSKIDQITLDEVAVTNSGLTIDQLKRQAATAALEYDQAFGRVKHKGDWLTDLRFFSNMSKLFSQNEAFPQFDQEVYISLNSEDLFNVPVLFMTGHEDPQLQQRELLNLRLYLNNGGFLFASTCCSKPEFANGFRNAVTQMFPNDQLQQIPFEDPIYNTPYVVNNGKPDATATYYLEIGDKVVPLEGIKRDGRWIIVFSPVDFCCAIEEDISEDEIAYKYNTAIKIVANTCIYALTP